MKSFFINTRFLSTYNNKQYTTVYTQLSINTLLNFTPSTSFKRIASKFSIPSFVVNSLIGRNRSLLRQRLLLYWKARSCARKTCSCEISKKKTIFASTNKKEKRFFYQQGKKSTNKPKKEKNRFFYKCSYNKNNTSKWKRLEGTGCSKFPKAR